MKTNHALLECILIFLISGFVRPSAGQSFEQAFRQTNDGGYIITGYTGNPFDVFLVKTNFAGDTLWTRTYGGVDLDAGSSVILTSDGGYAVVGWTLSFGAGSSDIYLIKTDCDG